MAEGAVTIRAAGHTDIPALTALINRAYRGDSSRLGWTTEADILRGLRIDGEGLETILTDPDAVLFVAEAGELLASIHARHVGEEVHLGLFAVEPALQGRGIGTRLLLHAEAEAKKRWDVQTAAMEVITLRRELIAYYERHGYKRTGEHLPFPVSDLWEAAVPGLSMAVLEKPL